MINHSGILDTKPDKSNFVVAKPLPQLDQGLLPHLAVDVGQANLSPDVRVVMTTMTMMLLGCLGAKSHSKS